MSTALLLGLIWSGLWMAFLYVIMKCFPWEMLGYKVISEYSWAKSREMGARLRKSAKIPGFKRLFVKMWGPISKKMFGPDAGFGNVFYPKEKGAYRMDITKCPYNSYFTELGTPELTKIFCINDECTYGDIPGLEFIRHTTLGTGACYHAGAFSFV